VSDQRGNREFLFARAISGDANWTVMMTGLGILIVGGGLAFGLAPRLYLLWAALGAAVVVLAILAMIATRQSSRRTFDRWLSNIPFELDRELYRSALSIEKTSAVFDLRVRFASPVAESARSLIVNAVSGALRGAEARFVGDQLAITSPRMKCHFTGEENDYHDNRKLHEWMRRCVDRALIPIHARHPIRAMDLELR
jgi:hypothetical protein